MTSEALNPQDVWLLPGWQNSDAGHWQSLWQQQLGFQRLEQHNWQHPLRGDWSARLQEVVLDSGSPVVLVAHGLGCILTAWWAAHSPLASRVQAALLVAPCDTEREALRQRLPGWAPLAVQPLPFAAQLVGSQSDPHCTPERTQALAAAWGAQYVDGGARGHLNAESGLGDWTEGLALLHTLMKDGCTWRAKTPKA